MAQDLMRNAGPGPKGNVGMKSTGGKVMSPMTSKGGGTPQTRLAMTKRKRTSKR